MTPLTQNESPLAAISLSTSAGHERLQTREKNSIRFNMNTMAKTQQTVANGFALKTTTSTNSKLISKLNRLFAIILIISSCLLNCHVAPANANNNNNHNFDNNNYNDQNGDYVIGKLKQQTQNLNRLYRLDAPSTMMMMRMGSANNNEDLDVEHPLSNQQLALLASATDNHHHLLAAGSVSASSAGGTPSPGHYEFEVAPKMEPPSVRKPPYQQAAFACPGADPFAGFSPKDTLCGDLNQGRVPANPLGQMITGQAYPFELIKNKTLQFLARALPVLKLEYETIPKVARYLPANHLLNPTHLGSPLARDHMSHLNQRVSLHNKQAAEPNSLLLDQLDSASLLYGPNSIAPAYLRSARRKRHSAPAQHQAHITVAELSPNATLVVSSAHSGRIGANSLAATSSRQASGAHSLLGSSVVTKDGYRTLQQSGPQQSGLQSGSANNRQTTDGLNNATWLAQHESRRFGQTIGHQHQPIGAQLAPSGNQSSRFVGSGSPLAGQLQTHANLSISNASSTLGLSTTLATKPTPAENRQLDSAVVPSAASGGGQQVSDRSRSVAPRSSGADSADDLMVSASVSSISTRDKQQAPQVRAQSESAQSSAGQVKSHSSASSGGGAGGQRKRTVSSACSDLSNGFTTAICQAASALIEGDRPPAWLQLVKHIGSAYSGASETMAGAPIWSLLSGLSQAEPTSNAKSASSSSERPNSLAHLTKSNLIALLTPLVSLLGPATPTTPKDSSGVRHAPEHQPAASAAKLEHQVGPLATAMTRLALAGWATNAVASLIEYFVPSAFQTASRSFARRKKPFELGETFVDTPASLVAAATAAGTSGSAAAAPPLGSGAAPASPGKQPPTPCPSVEEYISPTFARNYQGSWKYVVQIPHEGYFTQTIQRTSCARQKCEFTDGVCHESPRWVSLLVAEIYYPNAIFGATGQPATGSGNPLVEPQSVASAFMGNTIDELAGQQMAAAPSSRHYQQMASTIQHHQLHSPLTNQQAKSSNTQDPLQMTDSLNAYNHNLNSAFISAANELGLDPNNVNHMQQLANAHNYQLLQRSGQLIQQQQHNHNNNHHHQAQPQMMAAESRASVTSVSGDHMAPAPLMSAPINQPQVSAPPAGNPLFSGYSNDYIMALAAAVLQQNPTMSLNDLIASLQMQTAHRRRKRRDIRQQTSRANEPMIQQRLSTHVEAPVNDIGLQQSQPVAHQHGAASAQSQGQYSNFKQSIQQIPQPTDSQQQQYQPQNLKTGNEQVVAPSGSQSLTASASATASGSSGDSNNQVECDGHDKIGCYVVRVYYDWFLVNGSCKCWKTAPFSGASNHQSNGQSGTANSFLRRIFTG